MLDTALTIENLLLYAEKNLGLSLEDKYYARNSLCELFQVEPSNDVPYTQNLQEMVDSLVEYAVEEKICERGAEQRFETKVLGFVTPAPSTVIMKFNAIKNESGIEEALKYLYNLSINNNYVKMNDIKKNIIWYGDGEKGRVAITINLSKPEKDPKQVLAERNYVGPKYPKCLLCLENIGFCGTIKHPARQTLRFVPIVANGEKWHLQYSPYVYFDEHCILFKDEHVPMQICDDTIDRLTDFVRQVPEYFLGSNADLPIVGGSILSHEHYQGGRKVLPMFQREMRKTFVDEGDVSISIRDWYNSVITIKGKNLDKVRMYAKKFLNAWKEYSDESANILAYTNEERHNTVTPIASMEEGEYIVDLILRNNRTDDNHPYGIFHPTEDMHNIKKESIGLIEAMGLFILPGRLKNELSQIMIELEKEEPDLARIAIDPGLGKHMGIVIQILQDKGKKLSEKDARDSVLKMVEKTCFNILECTAVFKNTDEGRLAFDRFIESVLNDGKVPQKKVAKKSKLDTDGIEKVEEDFVEEIAKGKNTKKKK